MFIWIFQLLLEMIGCVFSDCIQSGCRLLAITGLGRFNLYFSHMLRLVQSAALWFRSKITMNLENSFSSFDSLQSSRLFTFIFHSRKMLSERIFQKITNAICSKPHNNNFSHGNICYTIQRRI